MESKKENDMLIGANIKRERERAKLTQDQLSEMIGIGTKSLSAIERGTVGVSLITLKKICQALAVSSDVLLFGDLPKNNVEALTQKLERLTDAQYEITSDVIQKLIQAFDLK